MFKFVYSPKIKSALIVSIGGPIAFIGISLFKGDEKFYKEIVMPTIHKYMDPETAHNFAIKMLKYGLVPKEKIFANEEILRIKRLGIEFRNPIGLAAGFDKQGESLNGLFQLGFGFIEIGSVVPLPQEGNNKPRVFRLNEDKAIINRYGFNSEGEDAVYERIKYFHTNKKQANQIVGINLGKNKATLEDTKDFLKGLNKFSQIADYIVINVSSPNTIGLRGMQANEKLNNLLSELLKEKESLGSKIPILVKISPDLRDDELKDISDILIKKSIDGIIVCNTTTSRPDSLKSVHFKSESGGLSGRPLKQISNNLIRKMYMLTNGKITIIGVGGVENGSDALDKIKNGASLVQLYTAMTYDGPIIVNKIKKELIDLLKKEGFNSIEEAIGFNVKAS